MKTFVIDVVAGLLFLMVYLMTNNIYLATGVVIVVTLAQFAWQKTRGQPIAPMQWMIVGLVVAMGTATILTQNPLFVMLKPTFGYGCVGLIMLRPGWLDRYMPPIAADLIPQRVVVLTGYVYAAGMFALAAANLVVVYMATQKTWVILHVAGPFALFSILATGVLINFLRIGRRNFRARQPARVKVESAASE
jgi:intracellular septation protein A